LKRISEEFTTSAVSSCVLIYTFSPLELLVLLLTLLVVMDNETEYNHGENIAYSAEKKVLQKLELFY